MLEEILPFLLAGLAVTILLLLLAALQAVIAPLLAKGANPLLVAKLVALQLPYAVSQGLPIALLFATLLGLSRLSADSEIKAMQASGVSPARLFGPVMALGLIVTLLSFAVGELLTPRAKVQALSVQREIVLDNPRVAGLGGPGAGGKALVLRDAFGRAISVADVEPGGELRGLSIASLRGGEVAREIITARRGHLNAGSNVLELFDGQRITYQNEKPSTVLSFERGTLPVQDLQASFKGGDELKPVFLPLRVLWKRVQDYRAQNINAPQEFTALQRKFAEPVAALCMAFFAAALAVFSFRSNLNIGLVWVLLLTFLYYATWSVFRVMGENGALPAVLAAWTPDALYLLAGVGLLWVAARR
ncbi:LptF/LptG family permease [Deinococcus rubellus]|uniref:LptF/LptG family permease n=1 Tax=Deinococcus rubellus TaxID=1889240 RepID=A0ABY5YNC6_9DEIO|nr:LptF/LptG family permease [Deinococcus rubellus]UWX65577.1 LptF/LptG family permease [Deinococcus rubellus]